MSEVAAAPSAAPSTPAPVSGGGSAPAAPSNPSASSGGASAASTGAAPKPPAEKPAPRKLPEPVKLKVKGREESIDDLDRLVHLAQKGHGSAETFEEAKRLREEAAAESKKLEAFKSGDPKAIRAALRELGLKPEVLRAMSEDELFEAIQAEQMTPEQKRIAELESKLKEREEREKSAAQKAEEAAQKEADDREFGRIQSLFAEALQKTGASKETFPWLMQRMAKLEQRNVEAGIESTPEHLAAEALEGVKAEQASITANMSGEDLIGWLGEAAVKKINKAIVAKLRAEKFNPAPQPKSPQPNTQPQKARRFDWQKGQFVEE